MLKALKTENYYHSKINNDVCKSALHLIDENNKHFTQKSWNCKIRTSLNITNNILNLFKLNLLKTHTFSHIENYMHSTNNYFQGYIYESWVNVYEKDFFQEKHIHDGSVRKYISGVIYLTENNSELCLYPKSNPLEEIIIKPEFADIIIFQGDQEHRVIPNLNEELRISIAFNYLLCEKWKGMR